MCYYKIQRGGDTSPSLRGSGLKCTAKICMQGGKVSPSLRGSGLKFRYADTGERLECLPLYEGVD